MLRNTEPTIQEIRERVKKEWNKYYPRKPFPENLTKPFPENLKIEISNRLRKSAAVVYARRGPAPTLRFSRRYHDRHGWGDELTLTIKHEIVHIAYPYTRHSRLFYSEIQRIGAKRHCKHYEAAQTRTLYKCKACCHKFQSMNIETFCPKCDDLVEEIGKIEV